MASTSTALVVKGADGFAFGRACQAFEALAKVEVGAPRGAAEDHAEAVRGVRVPAGVAVPAAAARAAAPRQHAAELQHEAGAAREGVRRHARALGVVGARAADDGVEAAEERAAADGHGQLPRGDVLGARRARADARVARREGQGAADGERPQRPARRPGARERPRREGARAQDDLRPDDGGRAEVDPADRAQGHGDRDEGGLRLPAAPPRRAGAVQQRVLARGHVRRRSPILPSRSTPPARRSRSSSR